MQCRVCGAPMPVGASTCRMCGNFEAPAANPQGYGSPYQQADSTAYTQQYQQPGPAPYQQADQAGYNQQYQQPGPAPYQQADQAGYNQQYQQPGPASYQQADQMGYNLSPYQHPGSAFYKRPGKTPGGRSPYPGAGRGPGQQPAKKSSWGILVGIIALVAILGVVSSLVVSSRLNSGTKTIPSANTANQAPTTAASTPVPVVSTPTAATVATPTIVSTSTPSAAPSGNPIDAQAATIVTSFQTASAIDPNTYEPPPGTTTSTFKVNAPIYVQFHLDATKFSSSTQANYVNVRFYTGPKSILEDAPLQIKQYVTVGYFEAKYYAATQTGAAEIYWCHTADCSDGKLAQVVHFTVTA